MASRTGHLDIDPATRAPVPKASECGSPFYDSTSAREPDFHSSNGGGRRHGAALQGPPAEDEDCRLEVTREKLGCSDRARKRGTELTSTTTEREYIERRSTARTRRRTGLPLLSCTAFLFPDPTSGAKGSRTGHNDIDPATRALVPKASERGSPLCDSAKAVGGGRPKVVRRRRRRGRHRGNRIDQIGRKKKTLTWKGREGNTSTPTEVTRRHAKVAREGHRGERVRKDGKRLEGLKTPGKRDGATDAPTEATRRHAKVAREGHRGERVRKDGKRLEGLKTPGKRNGATNAPTEATRRHAKVAREGRREERATKDPNSTKRLGKECER
ncbi:hypothetical protein BJY52DRAFT_1230377 [Lactarius psammicola]|nr:hypothetical protein BJY52DRAFT_1230377 [Lactarius psammicola]